MWDCQYKIFLSYHCSVSRYQHSSLVTELNARVGVEGDYIGLPTSSGENSSKEGHPHHPKLRFMFNISPNLLSPPPHPS